jgi:DNA polymerase elongation subunit (family B)
VGDEVSILRQFNTFLKSQDPDVLLQCSDDVNDVFYIYERSKIVGMEMNYSKHLTSKVNPIMFPGKTDPNDRYLGDLDHPGRLRLDLLPIMKKHYLNPPLDGFDLPSFVMHKKVFKDGLKYQGVCTLPFAPSTFLDVATIQRGTELQLLTIVALERDNSFFLTMSSLSTAIGLDIKAVAERGQQARIKSVFFDAFYKHNIFFDHEMIDRPYVVVKRSRQESTYPDPTWLENPPIEKLRNMDMPPSSVGRLPRVVRDVLGRVVSPKVKEMKKTKKRFVGGFVVTPESGIYRAPEEAVATFDFASLYPSIIEAYAVCYRRVVYDRKWLDDPKCVFEYVPLDDDHCAVLVKSYDGKMVPSIIDKIVSELVKCRKHFRALLKQTTDPFERISLDCRQLSAKVIQNGLYGMLGSDTSGMLCTALSATVCVIGQWQNKRLRHYHLSTGGRCVYGDTDSIMAQTSIDYRPGMDRDAILTKLYERNLVLEKEMTSLYIEPNAVEFESMKHPFYMTNQKKTYGAIEYGPTMGAWKEKGYVCRKGFAYKKRDRCCIVHDCGNSVMDGILEDDMLKSETAITKAVDDLIGSSNTSLSRVQITCKVATNLKTDNLIQCTVVKQLTESTGIAPEPGRRIAFVFAEPVGYKHGQKRKVAEMGCGIDYMKGRKLHLLHYLEVQLLKPIQQLVQLVPRLLAHLDREISRGKRKLLHKSTGTMSIVDMFAKKKKHMKMQ